MQAQSPSEAVKEIGAEPGHKTDPLYNAPLHVVVLKWDRLYGDLVRQQILTSWPKARVSVFQLGFDALDSIQACKPDLFVTGARVDDMDGLEHLEPFIENSLPILILTSRPEPRLFSLVRGIRYDGIYDAHGEGLFNLTTALRRVLQHELYVSPAFVSFIKQPKNITLDTLTEKEQMVLSVIGDGSDDQEAARRLGLSPLTVNTHRKSIMAKLKLHHKGQLMLYALQQGYVQITPTNIYRPGFQRRIRDRKTVADAG